MINIDILIARRSDIVNVPFRDQNILCIPRFADATCRDRHVIVGIEDPTIRGVPESAL